MKLFKHFYSIDMIPFRRIEFIRIDFRPIIIWIVAFLIGIQLLLSAVSSKGLHIGHDEVNCEWETRKTNCNVSLKNMKY